jgi:hypothetical protein
MVIVAMELEDRVPQLLDTHTKHGSKKNGELATCCASLRLIMSSSTTRCGLLLAWLYLALDDVEHLQACAKGLGCFPL